MNIKAKLQSIRVGLKAGVKATDALLKMADHLERDTKLILGAIAEIKEITPEDEETKTK